MAATDTGAGPRTGPGAGISMFTGVGAGAERTGDMLGTAIGVDLGIGAAAGRLTGVSSCCCGGRVGAVMAS